MTVATTRLILFLGSYQYYRVVEFRGLPVNDSLGPGCRSTAHLTNSGQFGHIFGSRQKFRHNAERLAAKIRIQPRKNNPDALARQVLGNFNKFLTEKLRFVGGDRVGEFGTEITENFLGAFIEIESIFSLLCETISV